MHTQFDPADEATRAVVTVGNGREFVVECVEGPFHRRRLVIIAAHCLPSLPPCAEHSYYEDRIRLRAFPRGFDDQPGSAWRTRIRAGGDDRG